MIRRWSAAIRVAALALVMGIGQIGPVSAQTAEQRLRLLEQTVKDLLERDAEKEETIHRLRRELQALQDGHRGAVDHQAHDHGPSSSGEQGAATAHDHAHSHGHGETLPSLYAVDVAGGTLRLRGIGVSTAAAVGSSSVSEALIEDLQGGHHDPRQNGFTLQALDVSLLGSFDPYFDAVAHIAFNIDKEGESVIELEEAYLLTQEGALPGGLGLKLGQFFTEFGAYNQQHFHDQPFIDQPVIMTRLFGEDGLRGPGARLGWRMPVPNDTMLFLGVQNARGETKTSFLSSDEAFDERPIGGREFVDRDVDSWDDMLYFARLASRLAVDNRTDIVLGISGVTGPNATGDDARTYIVGADARLHRDLGGGRYLDLQGELAYRLYRAEAQPDEGFEKDNLKDYGFYAYAIYGFAPRWSGGMRVEYAAGSGESVGEFDGRKEDPFRSNRLRLSPLVAWQFAPTASVRLQYNYDYADFLPDRDAHTAWLGFKWAFGAGEGLHVAGRHGHHHH